MALVKAGWFQTTWFPSGWWHEDWWLEYGTAVPVVATQKHFAWAKPRPSPRLLQLIKQYLDMKVQQ